MKELIKQRYSVRTYDPQPVESDKVALLKAFMAEHSKGPFGNETRFVLIEAGEATNIEIKELVSYGNVKGASLFIAGAVKKAPKAMEDYGYCLEQIILYATSLELGTVWLGGSFNRSSFAQKLGIASDEVIPAVVPLGYAADKRSMVDKIVRRLSGGNFRKEFGEVFFYGTPEVSLSETEAGDYEDALEALRWAPSASNKQPWRVIKAKNENIFHFYLNETFYNKALKDVQIQNVDMGIGMSHFEAVAKELGLNGTWEVLPTEPSVPQWQYIVTWRG